MNLIVLRGSKPCIEDTTFDLFACYTYANRFRTEGGAKIYLRRYKIRYKISKFFNRNK